jgi:hypothetical protein
LTNQLHVIAKYEQRYQSLSSRTAQNATSFRGQDLAKIKVKKRADSASMLFFSYDEQISSIVVSTGNRTIRIEIPDDDKFL